MKTILVPILIMTMAITSSAASSKYAKKLDCSVISENGNLNTDFSLLTLTTRLNELSQLPLKQIPQTEFSYREITGFTLESEEFNNGGGYNGVLMSEKSNFYQYRQTSCDTTDDYFNFHLSSLTYEVLLKNNMLVRGYLNHQTREDGETFEVICTAY